MEACIQGPTRWAGRPLRWRWAALATIKENIAALSEQEAAANPEQPGSREVRTTREARCSGRTSDSSLRRCRTNLASADRKTLSPFEITPVLTRVLQTQQKLMAVVQERILLLEAELGRIAATIA